MHAIRSVSLELTINPDKGVFSIFPLEERFPRLEDVRLRSEYLVGGALQQGFTSSWEPLEIKSSELSTVEHGIIDLITIQTQADRHGIDATLTFGVTREYPLVLWKVKLHNGGSQAVRIRRIDMLNLEPAVGGRMKLPRASTLKEEGFFSNGWQSWSPSRWYRGDSRMNISRLGFLHHPMIYNPDTPLPRRRGEFSSDMFAVVTDQIARTGFLVGFLAQKNHFGSIIANLAEGSLAMWADGDDAALMPGCDVETDWAVFTPLLLDHRDPLEAYVEAVGRENHARVPDRTPVGWCSWYQYYTDVTHRDLERNLETIINLQERLPIEIVQLDDGFESNVGEWFTFKSTFPDGVKPIAEMITNEGLVPGIWLAPFIVNPSSRLMRDHPDWILKRESGRPVNAGFGWNALTTGLDMTVPAALDFIRDVMRTAVEEWGFRYLKLDFYYAAGLKGNFHDPTKTRAQVLRMGMEAIREVVGQEVTLLGCGAPLGSMIGIVDLMRIGPDVGEDWFPEFRKIKWPFKREPAMPCARNSVLNTLTRANLHRKWWINDPDCLLVRPDSNLTLAEVQSLATAIGLTGGALLISDDLTTLPAERLSIAEALVPIIEEPLKMLDLLDAEIPSRLRLDPVTSAGAWHVLAGFNWSDQPADVEISRTGYRLEEGTYLYREFWSGETGVWSSESPLIFRSVSAHGCVLLAIRRDHANQPQYVGSDLHISQGIEVNQWQYDGEGLTFTLQLPRTTNGNVFLYLPGKLIYVEVNGAPVEAVHLGGAIHKIPVEVEGFSHIHVQYIKE